MRSGGAIAMPSQLVHITNLVPEHGFCFVCDLPSVHDGDTAEHPNRSRIEIFEDATSLGPAHAAHDSIRRVGRGRYSHWHNVLYLSASDNSDPRRNGRRYSAYVPGAQDDPRQARLQHLVLQARESLSANEAYTLAEALFYEIYPAAFLGESSKACWDDRAFVDDYRRLVGTNRRSFERKWVVAELVKALGHVPGDVAECGVYNGSTAFFMAKAIAAVGVPRRLHLFDSFEGLSPPGVQDGSYWQAGDLAVSETAARAALAGLDDVAFYRGWIPSRFREVADRKFTFVHIDVDLYQPTLDSLTFFYPRMAADGIIVCDDYGFTTCPGATRAMREFMSDKPEHIVHLPTGQGAIFRRSR
jgi:hypothetical protein